MVGVVVVIHPTLDPDLVHNVRGLGWLGVASLILFGLAFTRWGR